MTASRDRYRGCLLGGAIGDALGAPVEFLSLGEINREHGATGITEFAPAYGRFGAITDDTQMTLFTAEGLIRDQRLPGPERDAAAAIWRAYRRWLSTQYGEYGSADPSDGWLLQQRFLHEDRAPGTTCISSLWAAKPGSLQQPLNDSKGCGGVMRMAPVGLAADDAFELGCQAAALTHGHPSGCLAAGAFAVMIRVLVHEGDLRAAVFAALDALRQPGVRDDADEVASAVQEATRLATAGAASPASVASLGAGWVAEEALAIALYCALTARDFRSGVVAAVNHSGDSDSTGAICGNLLGASLGVSALDADLLAELEGREVITQVADDLHDVFAAGLPAAAERYPAG